MSTLGEPARGGYSVFCTVTTSSRTSWFSVNGADVRPQRYHAEDGSSSVSVDFDWTEHRARGETEGKPLDLKLADGAQDVMSIQIQVMLDLIKGVLPDSFRIFDKDEIKEFLYTNEGAARIRTELGELDTVVVASRRAGNNRILRMWFAPKLELCAGEGRADPRRQARIRDANQHSAAVRRRRAAASAPRSPAQAFGRVTPRWP